jgi:hypothetical protein
MKPAVDAEHHHPQNSVEPVDSDPNGSNGQGTQPCAMGPLNESS